VAADGGGASLDGGVAADGGEAADGGASADGGGAVADGGDALDGGAMADGGDALDGGAMADGGEAADGGATEDGGTAMDAGLADAGTQRTCEQIAAAYPSALQAAKHCDATADRVQCQESVPQTIGCGCVTYVEATNAGRLNDLLLEWQTLGCVNRFCPLIPCALVSTGVCTRESTCQDVIGN
jgi:hypothetical protein